MSEQPNDLSLSILDVQATALPGKIYEVNIKTSRGDVQGILHPAEGSRGAVIWVGGASGGVNGPAGGLYINLSQELMSKGITSLRLTYRFPDLLEECVLDTLAGVSLLHGLGATRIALVGHSFGGAVVITAGALSSQVSTVVALSSQSVGTHLVNQVAPRPLLLAHGLRDQQVSAECSKDIMDRAGEPKRLELYPNTDHDLMGCQQEIHKLVGEWLVEHIGTGEYAEPAKNVTSTSMSFKVFPSMGNGSARVGRDLDVVQDDITSIRIDAIVNPTSDDLWLSGAVGEAIRRRGRGEEIEEEATRHAPIAVGSVVVTGAGNLAAKFIIHAVVAESVGSFRSPTAEKIEEVTKNALQKADEMELKSIAFPALGTGGGGLALEKAAEVMVNTIVDHLRGMTGLQHVMLVVNGTGAFRAFAAQLQHTVGGEHGSAG